MAESFLYSKCRIMQSMVVLTWLCTITSVLILSTLTRVTSKTLESDIQVLRSIKQSIDPNSISSTSFINTWNFGVDPCETTTNGTTQFVGILCAIPDEDNARSRISEVYLEGDGLQGFLTDDIGNLTELNVLNLSKNRFGGPISNSIFQLRKITRLVLSQNLFSGSIPNGIAALENLEIMDLSQNRLSGSIPQAISGLRRIARLILSNNELSGNIPQLSSLWQLDTLDLGSNQLNGSLPALPVNLRSLLLGHNLLSGRTTYISRLRRIKTLDLSDNRFSGTINQEMLTLPELNHLNVSANHFEEIQVIKCTNGATQLRVLDAGNNRLRGRLPRNLITYENLTAIRLGHNMFSGKIPREYGRKLGRPWRSLFLDYNFLQGTMPSEFSSSSSGSRISGSLAHNCLTSCTGNIDLCRGGQRPASQCVAQKDGP